MVNSTSTQVKQSGSTVSPELFPEHTYDVESKKQRLVLLPGLGADKWLFQHQIDHLGETAEIIVLDYAEGKTRGEMASRVLDLPFETFALAGHSLGGWVAQEVAFRAPGRITRLALLNTWAVPAKEECNTRRRADLERIHKGEFEAVVRDRLGLSLHPDKLNDRRLFSDLVAMNLRVGADAYVRQSEAMLAATDSRAQLAQINCPTLVIHGRQDGIFSYEEHLVLATEIARARLAVIEECGHYAPVEQRQAVTALLRMWLLYD